MSIQSTSFDVESAVPRERVQISAPVTQEMSALTPNETRSRRIERPEPPHPCVQTAKAVACGFSDDILKLDQTPRSWAFGINSISGVERSVIRTSVSAITNIVGGGVQIAVGCTPMLAKVCSAACAQPPVIKPTDELAFLQAYQVLEKKLDVDSREAEQQAASLGTPIAEPHNLAEISQDYAQKRDRSYVEVMNGARTISLRNIVRSLNGAEVPEHERHVLRRDMWSIEQLSLLQDTERLVKQLVPEEEAILNHLKTSADDVKKAMIEIDNLVYPRTISKRRTVEKSLEELREKEALFLK